MIKKPTTSTPAAPNSNLAHTHENPAQTPAQTPAPDKNPPAPRGKILLISGPSGSGKSTLISRLFAEFDGLYFSISSTTRAPRDGERDGVNYHFITRAEFEAGVARGEFLEWAEVHGNLYGTSLRPVEAALAAGRAVVFDIDVQGFALARARYGREITAVFVTTKDAGVLRARLLARADETAASVQRRLANARGELAHLAEYDFVIVNDDLDASYARLRAIFVAMGAATKYNDVAGIIAGF